MNTYSIWNNIKGYFKILTKVLPLVIIVFLYTNIKAQSNTNGNLNKIIPFGSALNNQILGFGVSNTYNWKIVSKDNNKILQEGVGTTLLEFVFDKPGIYMVELTHNENHVETGCNHDQAPVKLNIAVSSTKMNFDFSKLKLSNPIHKGVNTQDILLIVPVIVSTYDNKSVKYNIADAITAGIGTEIIAKPIKKEVILNNGIQDITFKLSGTANAETYIMFDFIDINNQIQSYSHLDLIK